MSGLSNSRRDFIKKAGLVSAGITLIFSGKFQENLEELRKRRGMVQAAEINTMGVIGTAFLLGLNNMHRRKVRTGLTCATLLLITFARIWINNDPIVLLLFTFVPNDSTEIASALYLLSPV